MLSIRFALAALTAAILSVCPHAQSSRGMEGIVLDTSPHPLRVLTAPETAEELPVAIPVLIPRWDGVNDAGATLPARHLRTVQLATRLRLTIDSHGENASNVPVGRWRVETGASVYWRRGGSPAVGGGSWSSSTAAGHGLAPFDGALDGAGPSGWREADVLTPQLYDRVPVGTTRDELRAWCGSGSILFLVEPGVVVQDYGFPAHWREWATVTVEVLEVSVRYFLDNPPLAGAWRVEASPWVDHGILEQGSPLAWLDIPGASDPSRVLATWVEYAHEDHAWVGIENLAPFTATCGGSSYGGVRLDAAAHDGPLCYSNASSGVGTFAPVSAWDGVTDWAGVSGLETWGNAYATMTQRSAYLWGSGWAAGDFQLGAQVGHSVVAPVSLTPGAEFAWDGARRFSGRARAVRIVQP